MTARCSIRERERLHAKGDLERLGACGEQRHGSRGGQPLLPRRIVEEGVLPRQLSSLPLSVEGDRELLHGRGGRRTQRERSLVLLEAVVSRPQDQGTSRLLARCTGGVLGAHGQRGRSPGGSGTTRS